MGVRLLGGLRPPLGQLRRSESRRPPRAPRHGRVSRLHAGQDRGASERVRARADPATGGARRGRRQGRAPRQPRAVRVHVLAHGVPAVPPRREGAAPARRFSRDGLRRLPHALRQRGPVRRRGPDPRPRPGRPTARASHPGHPRRAGARQRHLLHGRASRDLPHVPQPRQAHRRVLPGAHGERVGIAVYRRRRRTNWTAHQALSRHGAGRSLPKGHALPGLPHVRRRARGRLSGRRESGAHRDGKIRRSETTARGA